MKMRRNVFNAISVIIILGTCETLPAFAETGQVAINALIGNTMSYQYEGADVYTYFAADGSMRIIMAGQREDTRWKTIDEKICFQQAGGFYGDCMMVEITGDDVIMKNDGTVIKAKLSKGNVKSLK